MSTSRIGRPAAEAHRRNLAEILDKLAYVIRERFKLRGRIRAISAHGRMTGTALTCIPIAWQ